MSEQELWEEILKQHNLAENRGRNTNWLNYGASYFDHETALVYDTADKRPDPRTARVFDKAKSLLRLIHSGYSRRKAAVELGIPWKSARYALKAYEDFTRVTSSVSSEGESQ